MYINFNQIQKLRLDHCMHVSEVLEYHIAAHKYEL